MAPSTQKETFDAELVADFLGEFQDAYDDMQQILIQLEITPDDQEKLNALFRVIHSIKSNLRMMQLNAMSDFVHVLEGILEEMRAARMTFNNHYSDLILLSVEQLRTAFESVFAGEDEEAAGLNALKIIIGRITEDKENAEDHVILALSMLDSAYSHAAANNSNLADDLEFFLYMAQKMEQRTFYEVGCTQRILEMALDMNEIAGSPVDSEQLKAAVFLHDVGMAFLPVSIVRHSDELNKDDSNYVHTHAKIGADLLMNMKNWDVASKIVRQHHERSDGLGYPEGIKGSEIHAGAKIIAIADTFEAMTHHRLYRQQKRPALRAVAEINGYIDSQFDAVWVEIFNDWVRKNYSNK